MLQTAPCIPQGLRVAKDIMTVPCMGKGPSQNHPQTAHFTPQGFKSASVPQSRTPRMRRPKQGTIGLESRQGETQVAWLPPGNPSLVTTEVMAALGYPLTILSLTSLARQSLSALDENAATEMRHSTTRSLPFSLPIWISWLYRKCLTTERLVDCGGSCIATSPTCWVMLGGMAGKAVVQGSNSWTVGWCWPVATQYWMHGTSATPTGEERTHWQPRGRCLPRSEILLYFFYLIHRLFLLYWCTMQIEVILKGIVTILGNCLFAFLPRVGWEYQYHSHNCPFNMELKPEDG